MTWSHYLEDWQPSERQEKEPFNIKMGEEVFFHLEYRNSEHVMFVTKKRDKGGERVGIVLTLEELKTLFDYLDPLF